MRRRPNCRHFRPVIRPVFFRIERILRLCCSSFCCHLDPGLPPTLPAPELASYWLSDGRVLVTGGLDARRYDPEHHGFRRIPMEA